MADPGIAEVAALAVTQENQPADPTSRRDRLAREVTRVTNEGHFREGLKKHAEAREVDFGGFDKKVAGFGVDIDNASGERTLTAEEIDYKAEIETRRKELTKFFDKGYDGMSGTEQTRLQQMIILQAKRNPAMATQIATLGGNEQAFAERFLRDPALSAHLKEILNENLEGNYDNTVLDAFDEWKTKEQLQLDANEEFTDRENRLKIVKARLKPFERNPNTGKAASRGATNAAEIDRIQDLSGSHTVEIAGHQQKITKHEQDIATFEREKEQVQRLALMRSEHDINQEIGPAKNELNSAQQAYTVNPDRNSRTRLEYARGDVDRLTRELAARTSITTIRTLLEVQSDIDNIKNTLLPTELTNLANKQGELQKLQDLQAMEQQLESERATLEDALREVRVRQRSTTEDASKAKRTYETARGLRLAAEKTFTERIKNAFGEAGTRTMNDVLQEASNKFDGELTKMKEEEKEAHAREALTAVQARWQMPPEHRRRGPWWNRRTETHRPINKLRLGDDFDTLLNHGDRQLVTDILTGRENPTTHAPYNADEINSLLDKKEFTDKIGQEAIKQLLAQRFLTGGFRREDINTITRSQWGQGMLDKAIEQNGDFRGAIERVMGQGAFNRTGFRERFSQIANEKPWLIYSLLGIPATVLMAMFGSAVNEEVQNQN